MNNIKQFKEFINESKDNWPDEVESYHGDVIFKLLKVVSNGAKYDLIHKRSGKKVAQNGMIFKNAKNLQAFADDYILPSGGTQSSRF